MARAQTQARQWVCGVRKLKAILLLDILRCEVVATAAGTSKGVKTHSWGQRLQVSRYIGARGLLEAATARAYRSLVNPNKMQSVLRQYWGGLVVIFLTKRHLNPHDSPL